MFHENHSLFEGLAFVLTIRKNSELFALTYHVPSDFVLGVQLFDVFVRALFL